MQGYSSHQFSVKLEAELPSTGDVPEEAARLYQLLQQSVDSQIQFPGFAPTVEGGVGASLARLRENTVAMVQAEGRDVLSRFGKFGGRKLAVAG